MENELILLYIFLAFSIASLLYLGCSWAYKRRGLVIVWRDKLLGIWESVTQPIRQTGTDKIMVALQRERQLMEDLEEIITDGLREKVTKGEWTKWEASNYKRRMANLFELKGLLPKGQLTLRETLLKNRDNRTYATPVEESGVTSAPAPPKKKTLDLLFKST